MKAGIVVSGGSLKGVLAHNGFFLALKKLGIEMMTCIGTSAGAISGGYICSGGTPEKLREILVNLKASDYIDKLSVWEHSVYAYKKFRGWTGLLKGDALEDLIRRIYPVTYFEEQPIPFYAHVANISRVDEECIHKGELAPAVRASAAIPFEFEMKEINGQYYWDGGVFGFNAINRLAEFHPDLDVIIVNDFHRHDTAINNKFMKEPLTPVKAVNKLVDCAAYKFDELKYEILESKYKQIEVISIRPEIPFSVDLQKPSKELANKVIDCGYNETMKAFGKLEVAKAEFVAMSEEKSNV